MKLKIILVLIIAFFSLAFAVSPRVSAEGEITTTIDETLTTTPTTDIGNVIDYELERAKTAIVAAVTSVTGVGLAGEAVNLFLKKKRAKIDASINAVKKAYDDQKAEADKIIKSTAAEVAEMKASAAKYQAEAISKIEASAAKLDATAAKVEAMEKAYQEREARMAELFKAELARTKTDGSTLVDKAVAIPGGIIGEE